MAAILGLINNLAVYEKEASSVHATEEKLLATLSFAPFPSSGYARALLLFAPASDPTAAQPAGMALYFYNYSTWRAAPGIWVEDLFVKPDSRGRGYGKRLLARLAGELKDMDGARLEWCVLKWNKPSIQF